jgi:hexosaminidase
LIEEQEIMRRPSSRYEFHGLRRMIARCIVPLIACTGWALPATGELLPIPMVKQFASEPGRLRIAAVSISAPQDELANEVAVLEQLLAQRHIVSKDDGTPIELKITDVQFPPNPSSYAERIAAQGYRIDVNARGVVLAARSPMGVYYAVQTLTQLITPDKSVQHVRILDWPDLAVRAVMVDPARANENLDYYQRMIAFAAATRSTGCTCT